MVLLKTIFVPEPKNGLIKSFLADGLNLILRKMRFQENLTGFFISVVEFVV